MDFAMDVNFDVFSVKLDKTNETESRGITMVYNRQLLLDVAITAWLMLCIMAFLCFFAKIYIGRRRIRENFSSIDAQLRLMQAIIAEEERAMAASNANHVSDEAQQRNGHGVKLSEDAQKLLDALARNLEKMGNDKFEKLEVTEETAPEDTRDNAADTSVEAKGEKNGNGEFLADQEDDAHLPNAESVNMMRDTIEDIIQEGARRAEQWNDGQEPSKKDD